MSDELLSRAAQYAPTPRRLDDPRLAGLLAPFLGSGPGCLSALGCAGAVVLPLAAAAITFWLGWSWLVPIGVFLLMIGGTAVGFVFDQRERANMRRSRESLLREGAVAMAHVVQANTALYESGDAILPALVVLTQASAHDLEVGRALARNIAALKRAPDPGGDAHALWKAVNDDHSAPKLDIAPALSEGRWACLSTVDVDQTLLPSRRLAPDRPTFLVLLDVPTKYAVMF